MAELQPIPARHGTATFVPAGQVIKIINTSGTQVVDTWAFALPKPEPKKGSQTENAEQDGLEEKKDDAKQATSTPTKKKTQGGMNFPSQEEAEQATNQGLKEGEEANRDADGSSQQKSTWGSYVPSVSWSSLQRRGGKSSQHETEQQKDSKTWGSYFPSGKGFSTYVPGVAKDAASAFAGVHQRDPNKSYLEQLQQFSKTPVGAAGLKGLAALSGSGYGGSMYAGYQAWNQLKPQAAVMEFMSMPHSRAATLHLRPRVNDTLVSNLREPVLTLVEDSSSGIHDTLIAACDPARYRGLGVENWEEHGSCAENLVLALKELNDRAGLKGAKGVGAEITVNSVPAPLNLFMNIPWDADGDLGFHAPKCKAGDYVRLKAERDVVVVMSACPQDILDINNKEPTDAHFFVEGNEEPKQALKRTQVRKRPPPRKISSSRATSTVGTESGATPVKKPVPQKKPVPAKKPTGSAPPKPAQAAQTKPEAQTPSAPAQATQTQPPKKFVPRPVKPASSKQATPAPSVAGDNATPAVKKQPKKLAPRAKPTPQAES